MPPKPQVFKSPDGKEFTSKSEWRDYMMANFYSFKNKKDESNPLIKMPGSIDGQMFDIADCENCTMVVLDHTEQIQIDQLKNCRVFIAACASSIFIRNCTDCTFYTCCRQLRLREVVNSNFYVYSMSEVHIEYSNCLKFAPFNGGYPLHSSHLSAANISSHTNLWYDIYDHNDSEKSGVNWLLMPEAEYEAPWFPLGEPCELAIPRTAPQSAPAPSPAKSDMQSFSLQQMMLDAKKISAPSAASPVKASTHNQDSEASVETRSPVEIRITELLTRYSELTATSSVEAVFVADCVVVYPTGECLTVNEISAAAPAVKGSLSAVNRISVSAGGSDCFAIFVVTDTDNKLRTTCSAMMRLADDIWRIVHLHRSTATST